MNLQNYTMHCYNIILDLWYMGCIHINILIALRLYYYCCNRGPEFPGIYPIPWTPGHVVKFLDNPGKPWTVGNYQPSVI